MNLLPWPDEVLVRLGLSIVIAWTAGAMLWFALRTPSAIRVGGLCLSILIIGAAPMLIPADNSSARALAVFVCFDATFRLIDAHRRAAEYASTLEGLGKYLRFFVPFPVLLVTGEERSRSEHATSPIRPAIIR